MEKDNVTVLLIDDDEVDVMGIKRAFRQHKLDNDIVVASDGYDALSKLRDGKSVTAPYLILLDLNMPKMDGIEFLHQTRADPALRSSIIFVLTTSQTPEDKARAYEHNIAGYLIKDGGNGGFIDAADLLGRYARAVAFP